jgi:hypothetical protein
MRVGRFCGKWKRSCYRVIEGFINESAFFKFLLANNHNKIQPSGLAAMYVKEFDVCYFIKICKIAKCNIW